MYDTDGIAPTIGGMQVEGENHISLIKVGNVNPSNKGMNGNVFDSDGLSPAITTNKGEGLKILIKNATKEGYLIAENGDGIDIS